MVYADPARGMLMPGLMAQLTPGYVDAVVLGAGGSPAAEVAKVSDAAAASVLKALKFQ
jgi:hypothetical protein